MSNKKKQPTNVAKFSIVEQEENDVAKESLVNTDNKEGISKEEVVSKMKENEQVFNFTSFPEYGILMGYFNNLNEAAKSNDIAWMKKIVGLFNSESCFDKFDSVDFSNYMYIQDPSILNESVLYFYKVFKYIKNREQTVFEYTVRLANHQKSRKLYDECLVLTKRPKFAVTPQYLHILNTLANYFNDYEGKEKFKGY